MRSRQSNKSIFTKQNTWRFCHFVVAMACRKKSLKAYLHANVDLTGVSFTGLLEIKVKA